MQNTYKIGQKVRLTSNSEILGSSDALKSYLGSVVTIASVDEDGVYTIEEIDGFEISEIDIEEAININFTKWVEECVCPFCGSGNYSDEPYYETTEVFRDFTCNDCESEWSERYNLTLVTANDIDFAITSESEDRLQTQNNQLKTFIKNLGYNEYQIDMICNGTGMIVPKNNYKALMEEMDEIHRNGIKQDIEENGIEKIIKRELANYECDYTGEIEDAVEALEDYGITYEQVLNVFRGVKC